MVSKNAKQVKRTCGSSFLPPSKVANVIDHDIYQSFSVLYTEVRTLYINASEICSSLSVMTTSLIGRAPKLTL